MSVRFSLCRAMYQQGPYPKCGNNERTQICFSGSLKTYSVLPILLMDSVIRFDAYRAESSAIHGNSRSNDKIVSNVECGSHQHYHGHDPLRSSRYSSRPNWPTIRQCLF